MPGIWSIAKQTFTQCVRMKLAAAFVVLMVIALLVLGSQMTGDDTLAGQIRTFLDWGTGITVTLLSVMTVFVGASLVSTDVRTRQIFTVATKPLARWQYIVGRWAGLVLFDAVLLTPACLSIYATAQYLRTKETTPLGPVSRSDRRAVETEIFAARRRINPDPLDLKLTVEQRLREMRQADIYDRAVDERLKQADGNHELAGELLRRDIEQEIIAERTDPLALETAVGERIAKLKETGQYENALEGWMARAGGNTGTAEQLLVNQLRRQIGGKLQSIAPNRTMKWMFSNIRAVGRAAGESAGVVVPIDANGMVRVRASGAFVSRLWLEGPVKIRGFDAQVVAINGAVVTIRLDASAGARLRLAGLEEGDTVELVVEPILQITYKLTSADYDRLPNGEFLGRYQITDGSNPGRPWLELPGVTRQKTTLTVSSHAVGKDGRLQFAIHNDSPVSADVLFKDVGLLYNVDSFENNFLRASLLMLCQLAYVAAASVFAGSFVSFPVACLLCFVLIPFSLGRGFLIESVSMPPGADVDALTWLAHYIYKPLNLLLPDFARTMPGYRLRTGMDMSWSFVGSTAAADIALRAALALLIACIIFGRRELARVQV